MAPGKPDYSTLEVDERADILPEVIYKPANGNDLPEALNTAGKEVVAPAPSAPRPATICGIRKRTFWILLAGLITALGVAIGVGVGVGLTRNNDSSEGGSSSTSGTATRQAVAANSRLAANNYTDSDGVVHSQLYYQANSLDIWNADFNNATSKWTLSQVVAENNRTDMTPRNGTPIACGNWWHNEEDSDFRVLWADANNSIRAVYILDESISGGWNVLGQVDNLLAIDENSSLVHYLAMCNQSISCNSADVIGYESPGSEGVQMEWRFGKGDSGRLSVKSGSITPDQGTAMAVAPIPKISSRNMSYPVVALYLIEDDNLVELWGGSDIDWTNTGVTADGSEIPVDSGAQLAAMSQYRDDDFNVQIFMTQTKGGVKMAYMNGDKWAWMNSVDGMEDVMPLSPIAANQLGRVYAFENSTGEPQIVEWQRITGTTPTFERIGVVNTTGDSS